MEYAQNGKNTVIFFPFWQGLLFSDKERMRILSVKSTPC